MRTVTLLGIGCANIDGRLVHAGGVPSCDTLTGWFQEPAAQ